MRQIFKEDLDDIVLDMINIIEKKTGIDLGDKRGDILIQNLDLALGDYFDYPDYRNYN